MNNNIVFFLFFILLDEDQTGFVVTRRSTKNKQVCASCAFWFYQTAVQFEHRSLQCVAGLSSIVLGVNNYETVGDIEHANFLGHLF